MSGPGHPRDFALLVPPGWVRIPVGESAPAEVARIVSARFQALPATDRDAVRHRTRAELLDLVTAAARAGGLEVYLSVDPVRGRAVGASCIASFVPPAPDDPGAPPAAVLAALAGDDAGTAVQSDLVAVGGERALRRRYRREPSPADGLPTLPVTRLDYLVPVPASPAFVLLSFSTANDAIAEPLVALFDAMATSLRWSW